MADSASLPFVSVIVPCRNEARFIETCLRSIIENGYPLDRLEVLVVDGASDDGTPQIIDDYCRAHPQLRRLSNPRKVTPVALNIGIAAARGSYIVWMSAHNRYDRGYIQSCVEWAVRSGADNVGGIIVTEPREASLVGRAIAAALSHPFGVGGSRFRTASGAAEWADSVFGGCYRREVFERIGLFNERLVRGQDFELNMRLKRAGLRTLLVPSIRSTYYARSGFREFLRHNWTNGEWAILPFRYSEIVPVSARHLVPMFFAASVLASLALAAFVPALRWLPLAILGPYFIGAIAVGAVIGKRELRLALVMPIVFAALHLSYGLGSLWGAVRTPAALTKHLLRVLEPRRA